MSVLFTLTKIVKLIKLAYKRVSLKGEKEQHARKHRRRR